MSYIGAEPIVSATRTITEVTATAGQTVFTANGGYTVGYIDVFLNGVQLQAVDFTATNGTTVTLASAAALNDEIRLVAWGTFQSANAVALTGDSNITGNINVSGNLGVGTTSPAYQLDLNGGTTVNNRVQLRRGSDDANQTMRLGWDRIESVRADVALSSPQTSLSFIQTGSNGSRTTMLINSNGSVTTPFQPMFAVYSSGTTASNTAYVYDTVDVNVGSYYNTSNGRFTAPVAGTYFISAYCGPTTVDTWGGCDIRVNNTLYKGMYVRRFLTNGGEWCTNTTVLNLSANDYVTIFNGENTVQGGRSGNGFCGYLIG